ncbi:MAG: AbrB/MazE/SpoVT family DNA-binding domain-containing protein [Sulfuritalea sp.]|nr:AbrB/MazE/SpoVT family DNA-binding domain-containing protein [Sulfuritalea sp.]
MIENRTAKLFKNGANQAVRLPAEFRFEGKEIFVNRDETTGDVRLSTRPAAYAWGEFFELVHSLDLPDDFMSVRPMNASISK